MSARFDEYVMGNTSAEYQRLRMQARAWEEATVRVLKKAGLTTGQSCLDAGCGPGEVMRLMREIVGPSGHVTGVDADGNVGAEALTALTSVYGQNISFHQTDLTSGNPIPNSPYDMVFARLVLFHQRDKPAFVQNLWNLTKPGGALVIMDYDIPVTTDGWGQMANPIRDFIVGTFKQAGLDPAIGRKLPEYFVTGGIGRPDGVDASTLFAPASELAAMSVSVAQSLLPVAERFGTISPESFQAMIGDFNAAAAKSTAWMYWPMMVAAWKTKPKA